MDTIATYTLLSGQDEEEAAAIASMGTILGGSLEARIQRSERHRNRRLYLRRAELLPSPRENTPWQAHWNSQDDRAFITTMGFDVKTFHYILEARGGFQELWNASPSRAKITKG